MKIIIAVNGNELCNTLSSLDVPQKDCFDEGSRFICGDLAGRRVRHKRAARSFGEFKAKFEETAENFSTKSGNAGKTEPLTQEYINYPQRREIEISANIKELPFVSTRNLIDALEKTRDLARVNPHIKNMKLSELIYIINQSDRNGSDLDD